MWWWCVEDMQRAGVMNLYRGLLRTGGLIPDVKESMNTIHQVKSIFRKNRDILEDEEVTRLLLEGEGRLRFLKTRARKSAYHRRYKGYMHAMIQGDTVVEVDSHCVEGREMAFYKDKRLDPDAIKRHHKLLRRQYFMDPPPIK